MENYKEKLSAIQWITNNQKFNEHQLIQLGDAICAFHDCIEENKKLRKILNNFCDGAIDEFDLVDIVNSLNSIQ